MSDTFLRLSEMPIKKRVEYEKQLETIYTKGLNGFIFQRPFKEFNDFNLKYTPEHLAEIGKTIIFLPIEWMAKYADAITVNMVKYERDDLIINNDSNFDIDKDYDNINTTSIGNLAYISLNINDKEISKKCDDALQKIFKKYYKEVMYFISKQTKITC